MDRCIEFRLRRKLRSRTWQIVRAAEIRAPGLFLQKPDRYKSSDIIKFNFVNESERSCVTLVNYWFILSDDEDVSADMSIAYEQRMQQITRN